MLININKSTTLTLKAPIHPRHMDLRPVLLICGGLKKKKDLQKCDNESEGLSSSS
jgi:hypothetical protein